MDVPVYKLTIDEEDLGIEAVALVDQPAIMVGWAAFKDIKPLKFEQVGDKQIVTGALMIPDLPILRRDEVRGEHYVVFDSDTIKKAAYKFFKNNYHNSVNLMHDSTEMVEDAVMIESYFIDKEYGKSTPKGFDELPDGTWWGTYKINNKKLWDEFIKTGQFSGFSVEGIFKYEQPKTKDEELIDAITNEIIGTN
jgi:hypothetical protein